MSSLLEDVGATERACGLYGGNDLAVIFLTP